MRHVKEFIRKSEKEGVLSAVKYMFSVVHPDGVWTVNGQLVKVISLVRDITNEDDTEKVTVFYSNLETGETLASDAAVFMERFNKVLG